jgi:hypothetical protein
MKYRVYKKLQDVTNKEDWVMTPDGKLFFRDYDALTGDPEVYVESEYTVILKSIEYSLKIMNNIISGTIKAEDGEESFVEKFKDIKSFTIYLKAMTDVLIRYVEENNG